ncbi:Uncharacterised protein [Mycobacteroides abscessus subsp. abscessus]|nr:Uncharacterised protein [Mycobacteroides abscessus subsp. abscessus]
MSLFQLTEQLRVVELKFRAGPDLGDQIVIVGVKPLGHFQRRDIGVAACCGKVAIEVVGDARDAGRKCTQQHRGVQHLVVVGEGVHWNRVEPSGC